MNSRQTNAPILIVEDDADQLSVLAMMLTKFPNPVISAMRGERALEILRTEVPILAIVDMVLPDISGSQIVREIRADDRLNETKIIIVTSFLKYVNAVDAELADKVLVKPSHRAEIEAIVTSLLGYG